MDFYDNFIFIKEKSLSPEICKKLIQIHTEDEKTTDGCVFAGVMKDVKDTTDLTLRMTEDNYIEIKHFLHAEVNRYLLLYIDSLPKIEKYKNYLVIDYYIHTFLVQKYEKNKGKYIYHHDGRSDYENCKKRIFTYLWYLNTVDEGGETEFIHRKIKPEEGKFIMFPASWTFPHCGNVPVSDDKYILTGWVYTD